MNTRIPEDQFKAAMAQHDRENKDRLNQLLSSSSKEQILRSLAPEIAQLLDAPNRRGFCPNPAHKQKSGKAFRLFPDFDTRGCCICNTCGPQKGIVETLMFVNGWDIRETMQALKQYFDIRFEMKRVFEICGRTYTGKECDDNNAKPAIPAPREYKPAVSVESKSFDENREVLKRKQQQLLKLDNQDALSVVKNYLESRGIPSEIGVKILGRSTFVSLSEKYFYLSDSGSWEVHGNYPCLFQLVVAPDGQAATFHRHYLNAGGSGKAKLEPKGNAELPVKKSMKYCAEPKGCYMPVGAGPAFKGPIMGVGEGLETTLSGAILTGLPSRAASAGMLRFVAFPLGLKCLVHFCDPDMAGLNDGDELKKRCHEHGIQYIRELPPPLPGRRDSDWNDVLKHYGYAEARNFIRFKSSAA